MKCSLFLKVRFFPFVTIMIVLFYLLSHCAILSISGLVSTCVVYQSNVYQGPFLCHTMCWSHIQWSVELSQFRSPKLLP